MAGFDESKYYLGKLCKRGHEYEGTGKSLRSRKNSQCPLCRRETSATFRKEHPDRVNAYKRNWRSKHREHTRAYAQKWKIAHADKIKLYEKSRKRGINRTSEECILIGDNKYLGTLCKRGHRYASTEKSLRYLSDGKCIECGKIVCKHHRDGNREHYRDISRKYYQANKEYICKKQHLRYMADKKKFNSRIADYRRLHRDRMNMLERNRRIDGRIKLCSAYLRGILHEYYGVGLGEITPQLIELKRIQLKAYRASQAYKKGKLTCQTNS